MTLIKMNNKTIDQPIYCKRFYRPFEVSSHAQQGDCWIIINQYVLDISKLTISLNKINGNTRALQQLIKFGGIDVSELLRCRDELPMIMFNVASENEYGIANHLFWWNDPTYIIGGVTVNERFLCITNSNNGQLFQMIACEEDSIYVIQQRFYEMFPGEFHEHSIWRKDASMSNISGQLFPHKTLTENGIEWISKADVTKLWIF